MILEALKYLASELNITLSGSNEPMIALGNVARLDMDSDVSSSGKQQQLLISLINIEEEKTLRNEPFYVRRKDPADGSEIIEKRNPTLHLNLYLLISHAGNYEEALGAIDAVVEYLQGKNVFTAENAVPGSAPYPVNLEKMILDLFSPNFEQINHLWSILGGKYVPSVLYKMRLLPVQAGKAEKVGVVEEVRADSNINN